MFFTGIAPFLSVGYLSLFVVEFVFLLYSKLLLVLDVISLNPFKLLFELLVLIPDNGCFLFDFV
jgi:hypothetical protein